MASNIYLYDNLSNFENNIEIVKTVKNKLEELTKMFSLREDQNNNKLKVSPTDIEKVLSDYYLFRDGAKVLKEFKAEGTLDPKTFNSSFSYYMKKKNKSEDKETKAQYEALFNSDPYVMKDVEKVLGYYNVMKNEPTILISGLNLKIDDKYVDITYQLNQEVGTVSGIVLEGKDAKGKDKSFKIDQDTLFIDKINYNNTMDLISLDGTVYYNIDIVDVINISHNIDKDKIVDLSENITHLNVNDIKFNNLDKQMIIENTIQEEKQRVNLEISSIS